MRGRCPCWPQAEPFDAAEMDLLAAMQAFINSTNSSRLWAKIEEKSLALRRHRRAYVLSTVLGDCRYSTHEVTLLGWVAYDGGKVRWLMDSGVCPNLAATQRRPGAFGWIMGPVHPGRPAQDTKPLCPFQQGTALESIDLLLLAAGSYPVSGGLYRSRESMVGIYQRQWHAWHARASRRLWLAAML